MLVEVFQEAHQEEWLQELGSRVAALSETPGADGSHAQRLTLQSHF